MRVFDTPEKESNAIIYQKNRKKMKTIILGGLILASLSFGIVGCKKDNQLSENIQTI